MRAMAIAAALLMMCGAAAAQDAQEAEGRARQLEKSRAQPEPVWPEGYEGDRALPGSLDASRPTAYGRLREGAFIRDRRGRLGTSGDHRVIVFDADKAGAAPEPLRLLPCLSLMEMERLAQSREGSATFHVSGQVFEHRGRAYLMPMSFSVVASDAAEERGGAASSGTQSGGSENLAESIMSSLEGGAPARRPARAPASSSGEGVESAALLREGEFLNLRRGRIDRSGALSWTFTFENDADAPAIGEPPMRLLACRTTERMERIIERLGERTPMTVSGEVFVYEGENYLLPTMVLVDYPGPDDIASAQ